MLRTERALILAAVAASLFHATPASAAEVIYVIRHLQKAAVGDDPALTPEGAAGAGSLANILAERGIRAVFATPTRRAIQTATPLAVRLGLPVKRYDPANTTALIEEARGIPGNILVVGHSNTVPDLVELFGGDRPSALTEQDYGTIYIVYPASKEVGEITLPAVKAN